MPSAPSTLGPGTPGKRNSTGSRPGCTTHALPVSSVRAATSTASATCSGSSSGNPASSNAACSGSVIGVQGFYLGRLMAMQPALVREAAEELLALWRRGDLDPIVGAEYPLAEIDDALALIGSRRSTGKVVLVP